MPRKWLSKLLLVWITAALITGCDGRAPTPLNLPVLVTAPTPTATSTSAPLAVTKTPRLATISPSPTFSQPHIDTPRPASGWTVFTNPNFVQGLAVHDRQLWAATLGGVVAWNLDNKTSTLFTPRDGLVEIQANDIVYCSMPQERILVAHPSGSLSAYDLALRKWSRIPITFDDGSTFSSITTLFCDAENRRLLVGSPDGLGIFDEQTGHWKHIRLSEGAKTTAVSAINVVGQAVWVAAGDRGSFLITGSTVFPFTSAAGFPAGSVNDLAVSPDASIWFGYSTGLIHYREKKWNAYVAQNPTGIPFHTVDYVVYSPDRHIWIASANEGACPFDPVTLSCSTVYPSRSDQPITALAVDDQGDAYAGTRGGGVLVLGKDTVDHLETPQTLMSNDVMDIAETQDGKIWVATDRGINILDPAHLDAAWQTILPRRNQLLFPRVSSMLPAAKGMWFFYDQEARASLLDGDNWLQLDSVKGLTGIVRDSAVDQRGYVWLATTQGIKVWDGSLMRSYIPPSDPPGRSYQTLLEQNGVMWIGTDRGLLQYSRFQWQVVLPTLSINDIAINMDGGLLLGTDHGLIRIDGNQAFEWMINLGDEVVTAPQVTAVNWDGNHNLWVGTAGQGLFRYSNKRWERFDTSNGLPTNTIRAILADHQGSLWIAAVTGEGGGSLVRYVP